MAYIRTLRKYDTSRPLYVMRRQKVGERVFVRGDLFPADVIRELGTEVTLRLWRVGDLDHESLIQPPPVEAKAPTSTPRPEKRKSLVG